MKDIDSDVIDAPIVREKASHRKGRTSQVVRSARIPTQERSKKRYQSILEATIQSLQTTNIEDISLHDIGKATGLPPASVHYLFNTVTAIHVELNKLFNEQLTQLILDNTRELADSNIESWQDLIAQSMAVARNELNSNRPMAEVMLGPVLHRSMRVQNLETNRYHGVAGTTLFEDFFVVPSVPNMATYFMFSSELVDGLWAGAYARCGQIDDETFTESVRACNAYLRCYLPEKMARRFAS